MPCDVFSNLLHSVTLPIDVHSDTLYGECCLGDSLFFGLLVSFAGSSVLYSLHHVVL